MPVMDISLIDKSDIKSAVNYLYEKLCQSMHDAVRDIKVKQPLWKSTLSKLSRTRRNWWSYDCKLTRNRNRLYFHLWKTAGVQQRVRFMRLIKMLAKLTDMLVGLPLENRNVKDLVNLIIYET